MNKELALKLKEAGFPTPENFDSEKGVFVYHSGDGKCTYVPILETLIEECDKLVEEIVLVEGRKDRWEAVDGRDGIGFHGGSGKTPVEAVANLWLSLKKK